VILKLVAIHALCPNVFDNILHLAIHEHLAAQEGRRRIAISHELRCATGRLLRYVVCLLCRLLSVPLDQSLCILEMAGWFPRPLLIAKPLDKILRLVAMHALSLDVLDDVLHLAAHESWWWCRGGWDVCFDRRESVGHRVEQDVLCTQWILLTPMAMW